MLFKKQKPESFDFDDDFNFDDFDFDSGGFEGKPKSKARKAVEELSGGFVSGVKDSLLSRQGQRKIIENALPKGYTVGYDAVTSTYDSVTDIYDTAMDESRKTADTAARTIKPLVDKYSEKLPNRFGNPLRKWTSKVRTQSNFSQENREELEAVQSINDIFTKRETHKLSQESVARQAVQNNLQKTSNDVLSAILRSQQKQAAYQEQVDAAWKRKTLELQYKQYFVQRKTLDVVEKTLELQHRSFEDIVKNTALPDFVKMHKSEVLRQTVTQELFGSLVGSFGQMPRDIASRLARNVTKKIKSQGKDARDMITDQLGQALDMMSMVGDMGDDMGGNPMFSMAGSMGGGALTNWLAPKLAKRLRKHIQPNGKIAKGSKAIEALQGTLPRKFMSMIAGGETGIGWLDTLLELSDARSLLNESRTMVQRNAGDKLHDPAYFDLLTKKSITEVIPGLLSKIHWELQVNRTGNTNISETVFDYKTNRFTTKKKIQEGIKKTKDKEAERLDKLNEEYIAVLEANSRSGNFFRDEPNIRNAFKLQLLTAAATGKEFDIFSMKDESGDTIRGLSYEARNKIVGWFMENYEITLEDGIDEYVPLSKRISSYVKGVISADNKTLEMVTHLNKHMSTLSSTMANPVSDAVALAKVGQANLLKDLGYFDFSNGNVNLNIGKYTKSLVGETDSTGMGGYNERRKYLTKDGEEDELGATREYTDKLKAQALARFQEFADDKGLGAFARLLKKEEDVEETSEFKTKGFSKGGYTGNKGTKEVAGIVHGKEFVFNADAVKAIGINKLESLHQSAKGIGKNIKDGVNSNVDKTYLMNNLSELLNGGAKFIPINVTVNKQGIANIKAKTNELSKEAQQQLNKSVQVLSELKNNPKLQKIKARKLDELVTKSIIDEASNVLNKTVTTSKEIFEAYEQNETFRHYYDEAVKVLTLSKAVGEKEAMNAYMHLEQFRISLKSKVATAYQELRNTNFDAIVENAKSKSKEYVESLGGFQGFAETVKQNASKAYDKTSSAVSQTYNNAKESVSDWRERVRNLTQAEIDKLPEEERARYSKYMATFDKIRNFKKDPKAFTIHSLLDKFESKKTNEDGSEEQSEESSLMKIAKFALGTAVGIIKPTLYPYKIFPWLAKKATRMVKGWGVKFSSIQMALWVKGDKIPRLTKHGLQNGRYVNENGDVIKTSDDFIGNIYDTANEVNGQPSLIVTEEEYKDGFYDGSNKLWWKPKGFLGKLKDKTIGKLIGFAGKMATLAKKTAIGYMKVTTWPGRKLIDWVTSDKEGDVPSKAELAQLMTQVESQEALQRIQETLGEMHEENIRENKEDDHKFNDKNRSGHRDGSAAEVMSERERKKQELKESLAKIKENAKEKLKEKMNDKDSLLGKLTGLAGGLMNGIGGLFRGFMGVFPMLAKVALAGVVGSFGIKKLLEWVKGPNADQREIQYQAQNINPNDPRIDPNSPSYDPAIADAYNGGQGQTLLQKGAGWALDKFSNLSPMAQGLIGAGTLGATWGLGKYAVKKGAGMLLNGAVGATKQIAKRGFKGALKYGVKKAAVSKVGKFAIRKALPTIAKHGAGLAARALPMASGLMSSLATAGTALMASPAAPFVLGAVAIGAAAFIGYKWWKGRQVDEMPMFRLRMASYGYDHKDETPVEKLTQLEEMLLPATKIKGKSEGVEFTNDVTIEKVMNIFGVAKDNEEHKKSFENWFWFRFVPVYTKFVCFLHRHTGKIDLKEADDLPYETMLAACTDTVVTLKDLNPYTVMDSPFEPGEQVELDKDDVDDEYKRVKKTLQIAIKKGKKNERAKAKEDNKLNKEAKANGLTPVETKGSKGIMDRVKDFAKDKIPLPGIGLTFNQLKGLLGGAGKVLGAAKDGWNKSDSTVDPNKSSWISNYFNKASNAVSAAATAAKEAITGGNTPTASVPANKASLLRALWDGMRRHNITSKNEQAAFLSQISVESGDLKWTEELASGQAYEGRRDLGNTQPGDGPRFKGRGLIQLTGRANYEKFSKAINRPDIMQNPSLVSSDANLAVESALYYWNTRSGLREAAQKGDIVTVSKKVNGGTNHLNERKSYFANYLNGKGPLWDNALASGNGGSVSDNSNLKAAGAAKPAAPVNTQPKATTTAKTNTSGTTGAGMLARPGSGTKTGTTGAGMLARPNTGGTPAKKETITNTANKILAAGGARADTLKVATPAQSARNQTVNKAAINNKAGIGVLKPEIIDKNNGRETASTYTGNSVSSVGANIIRQATGYEAFNIDSFVTNLEKSGKARSTGRCLQYVRTAAGWPGGIASAYMYHSQDILLKRGWNEIDIGTPPGKGDIVVIERNSAHPHGHIAGYTGSQWISDFKQRGMQIYATNPPPMHLYRHKDSTAAGGGTSYVGATTGGLSEPQEGGLKKAKVAFKMSYADWSGKKANIGKKTTNKLDSTSNKISRTNGKDTGDKKAAAKQEEAKIVSNATSTIDFGLNQFILTLRQYAKTSSTGKCATFVRKALVAAGLPTPGLTSAYMYADGYLSKCGFNQIDKDSAPIAGDIVVCGRDSKRPHGHIAGFTGKEWISDFIQDKAVPYGSDYKGTVTMWRHQSQMDKKSKSTSTISSTPTNGQDVKAKSNSGNLVKTNNNPLQSSNVVTPISAKVIEANKDQALNANKYPTNLKTEKGNEVIWNSDGIPFWKSRKSGKLYPLKYSENRYLVKPDGMLVYLSPIDLSPILTQGGRPVLDKDGNYIKLDGNLQPIYKDQENKQLANQAALKTATVQTPPKDLTLSLNTKFGKLEISKSNGLSLQKPELENKVSNQKAQRDKEILNEASQQAVRMHEQNILLEKQKIDTANLKDTSDILRKSLEVQIQMNSNLEIIAKAVTSPTANNPLNPNSKQDSVTNLATQVISTVQSMMGNSPKAGNTSYPNKPNSKAIDINSPAGSAQRNGLSTPQAPRSEPFSLLK